MSKAAAPSANPYSHIVEGSGTLVSAATTRMLLTSLFALIVSNALAKAEVPAFRESVKSVVTISSLISITDAINEAESFSV